MIAPPDPLMPADQSFDARRLDLVATNDVVLTRQVPIEVPVAIEYNGIGYAVMMATPQDLEAYAIGFTLSEGLVAHAGDIEAVESHSVEGGWVVRVALPPLHMDKIIARARTRVSESSCGLCGIESIAELLRPLPPITSRIHTTRHAIASALKALAAAQPLGQATGAAHVAAFCAADGAILAACEDVGRHNALDKLIGTLALRMIDPGDGFILLSARCSYELVEKTVRAGCPLLVTISAPTSLAVERARDAKLSLVVLARADSALILNDPHASIV